MPLDLKFTVPGDPVVKGRPRVTKYGRAYTPKKTVDAEKVITDLATELVDEAYDGPVALEIDFYCATARRTDGDNLLKLVLDAMNKIVFVDDYLVVDVHYRVHRKVADARTEVHVWAL